MIIISPSKKPISHSQKECKLTLKVLIKNGKVDPEHWKISSESFRLKNLIKKCFGEYPIRPFKRLTDTKKPKKHFIDPALNVVKSYSHYDSKEFMSILLNAWDEYSMCKTGDGGCIDARWCGAVRDVWMYQKAGENIKELI